jgi:hypothetical protein
VPNQDPARRYLGNARQVARATSLPDDLAWIAATGSCRDAIKLACQWVARRRLRTRGVPIAEIDERLAHAQTTMDRMAWRSSAKAAALMALRSNRRARSRSPEAVQTTRPLVPTDVPTGYLNLFELGL